MNKINSIKINGVTRNIENIAYLLALPTASAESPDFVSVDGVLYAKAYIDSTYTYKNLAQSLTAGDNISISDDGVISVTGELGTQIEANPELSGDETVLSSISIDGVNYEIGGSNDTNKVDLSTPFTSMGEIVIAQDTTSVKGSGVKVSDLATKSDLDDLTTTSEVNTAISNSLTGAVSTIKTSNLTTSRVLISDSSGKVAASSNVTTTELDYLDGVTSSIQTQLNAKQSTLIAGDNITIAADGTISAADGTVAYVEDDEILVLEEGTASGGSSHFGSGVEVIDITDLDYVPEEYRDWDKLRTCYLNEGGSIYHLSYDDVNTFYYECIDELVYKYIMIDTDFSINRNDDQYIATQEYVDSKISVIINDDNTIDLIIN